MPVGAALKYIACVDSSFLDALQSFVMISPVMKTLLAARYMCCVSHDVFSPSFRMHYLQWNA